MEIISIDNKKPPCYNIFVIRTVTPREALPYHIVVAWYAAGDIFLPGRGGEGR